MTTAVARAAPPARPLRPLALALAGMLTVLWLAAQFAPAVALLAPLSALTAAATAHMLAWLGLPMARELTALVHAGGFACEIDLACTARRNAALVWESIVTFYYRGRTGTAQPASPLATAPVVDGAPVAEWRSAPGSRARFGKLTGDYNGIHLSNWYARLFRFRAAFQHPQRALGQILAHLPGMQRRLPIRLDAWLKGPVYYGAKLTLRAEAGGSAFALFVEGDDRPAILGRLEA